MICQNWEEANGKGEKNNHKITATMWTQHWPIKTQRSFKLSSQWKSCWYQITVCCLICTYNQVKWAISWFNLSKSCGTSQTTTNPFSIKNVIVNGIAIALLCNSHFPIYVGINDLKLVKYCSGGGSIHTSMIKEIYNPTWKRIHYKMN